jgi:hypothetical protein
MVVRASVQSFVFDVWELSSASVPRKFVLRVSVRSFVVGVWGR